MATFTKLNTGKWQAQVARQGVRRSRTFESKQAAKDWAARQEHLILTAKPIGETVLFSEVLNRYASEVSPTKRCERWEILRLRRFRKDPIAAKMMRDLTSQDFAR
jgi:hypothetical protein